MEKSQREYYLSEQMKAIQKEIGDEEGKDEFTEIEDKIKKIKLSKEAREKAKTSSRSCGRYRRCRRKPPLCATILTGSCRSPGPSAPRSRRTSRLAQEVLDDDHFGLDKVKERIVEYLAVRSAPTS